MEWCFFVENLLIASYFNCVVKKKVWHRRGLEVLSVHRKSDTTIEVFLLKVEQGDFYIHGFWYFFRNRPHFARLDLGDYFELETKQDSF